jgi:hypothetical protein
MSVARKILPLLALALLATAGIEATRVFPRLRAMDFYHMWGVPLAKDALGSNPYAARVDYSTYLNGIAARSESYILLTANAARRDIWPMGTPFYYACFAWLPGDFERALAAFMAAQYLALIAAVAALARLNGTSAWLGLALGAATALAFNPFLLDVMSGNVDSFQLLAVTAIVCLSSARQRLPAWAFRDGFPGLLAALAMFKPNVLWVVVALAVHYAIVAGRERLGRALAVAAATAVACAIIGAAYFDGPAAWIDWGRYLQGMNGGRLIYGVLEGNTSMVKFLAEISPRLGIVASQALLTALVAAAFMLAAVRGRSREARRADSLALMSDAQFAASVGIAFMLATSPLVWPHYLVLALVPIAWLFAGNGGTPGIEWAALMCFGLAAPVIEALFERQSIVLYVVLLLAWVPLTAGLCAAVARGPAARGPTPSIPQGFIDAILAR